MPAVDRRTRRNLYEELESALLLADTGVKATGHLLDEVRRKVASSGATRPVQVKNILADALAQLRAPRKRDGATFWRAYRDLSDPQRFTERFLVTSWADYLHQRSRFTLADHELEARVRALTRRGAGGGPTVIKHGPLTYDQVGRIAYLNDHMIDLSARELGLLEVLLQRAGRLVSKDQLVERLCEWGEEVSNNAIEVYIHRLRKKIEKGPIRIATVRGLGYCLEKIPN